MAKWLFLLAVSGIGAGIGCTWKKFNLLSPPRAVPTAATDAPPLSGSGPAVTEAEALEFSRKLEAAFAANRPEDIADLFRVEELAERCVADLPGRGEWAGRIRADFDKNVTRPILSEIGTYSQYTFLHILKEGASWKAIFRHTFRNGGLNYHKIPLARFPDGRVGPSDIYDLSRGENFTRTARRKAQLSPAPAGGLLGWFDGSERAAEALGKRVGQLEVQLEGGDNMAALSTFRGLPEEYRREKDALLRVVRAAREVGGEDYEEMLGFFHRSYPDDAADELLSLEYYGPRGNFAKADRAIGNIARAIGDDPHLERVRAALLVRIGREAMAERILVAAQQRYPTYSDFPLLLALINVRQNRFAEAAQRYKLWFEITGLRVGAFEMPPMPEMANFLASPEFKELRAWDATRK